MDINASPDTVRAITKTFQLAGILDDRVSHPDKARIAGWAEQVERHRLTEPDLLDGLQAYYDSPSERAIQIGDLIHHARYAKRTRLDKELDDERDRRREEYDSKADELLGVTADALSTGPTKNRTPRLLAAEGALQSCDGKHAAQEAIAEWFAAKAEARRKPVPA